MNIITKTMKKLEYERYLRRFEEALDCMHKCVGGTATHQGYATVAQRYLDKALRIKCELDG